ncbi:MAG: putative porin [Bacteroidota bacterium]|nr:putative porin [Bacteroidota bacterium]
MMNIKRIKIKCFSCKPFLMVCVLVFGAQLLMAQLPGNLRLPQAGSARSGSSSGGDSLTFEHRDDAKDSITITYRYLDSLKSNVPDVSIGDFNRFFSTPGNYVNLGNNGTAAFPVLFTPILSAGWDAGFHAYDVYKYTLENTRFYQTTRPYTQLTYLLGTGKEQIIDALQTQNIKPNWNAGIDYRLISSPGLFQTQNANHNNYRFFSNYQGKRKRYSAYLVLLGNKLKASENGGITDDSLLADPERKRRITVPVNLGGNVGQSYNVLGTTVNTGNFYSNFTAFFRQSYDFGIKDSLIINDSITEYLFYPKLRFLHTINYSTNTYKFQDTLTDATYSLADAQVYKQWYNLGVHPSTNGLNFFLMDKWKSVSNDFAIRQFPQTKNPGQFIEAGIRLENFSGTFSQSPRPAYIIQVLSAAPITKKYYNAVLHGEYRNKTKNRKWDALLKGEFYAAGLNAADYSGYISLTRFLNSKFGNVQLSFQNVNRSPSYIFNGNSAFNLDSSSITKKENITVISAVANNPRFTLMVRNISIANYTFFKNYYQTDQFNGLVNITQITASTKNKIAGHLGLYSDFIIQQTTGNNPIRVPLFYTRQRLAFEGTFFKNLNLSTGIEAKYNTPYKANNYSPVMGQFFPQDTTVIKNLPEVNIFFDFRIKTFTGIVKIENLNTVDVSHGFGFTNNNFAAPNYPTPGFYFRLGVIWSFVN